MICCCCCCSNQMNPCDFAGVAGIGTVTALEILSAFPNSRNAEKAENDDDDSPTVNETDLLETLRRFREWHANHKSSPASMNSLRKKLKNIALSDDFPSALVVQSYIQPDVRTDLQPFSWRTPDAESLREFAKTTFGWTFARTDEKLLPLLRRLDEKRPQQHSIRNYFATQQRIDHREVTVSKRMRRAIEQMGRGAGATTGNDADDHTAEKPKKRPKAKQTQRKSKDTVDTVETTESKRKTSTRNTRSAKPPGNIAVAVPSTSASSLQTPTASPAKRRAAKVPDFRPPIPQREMDLEANKKRKQEASKIFAQSKGATVTKRSK